MAKFKAGDAVKLRDDVEYGKEYCGITLTDSFKKGSKYIIEDFNEYKHSKADYDLEGVDNCIGEDALEAWPESTEETMSNKIDPQLFELVKVVLPSLLSIYDPANKLVPNVENSQYMMDFSISIAKETLRLLREEKL